MKQANLDITGKSKIISTPVKGTNLEAPGALKKLSKRILQEIDSYCVKAYDNGFRSHLGASLIGHSCARYCWLVFRWAYYKQHGGRMLRLFNRGHREEERFIEWLRGIGFEVWDITEEGTQFRIIGVGGHFGGSLDSGARFPEHYNISEPLLLEFKTSGTGRKFEELKEKGVALAKPQHFAQMSTYGFKYRLTYALYMCINKNDDDLHVEVVKLNWNLGAEMEIKAMEIIQSETPPPRLSENPTYYECKYCDFYEGCHNNAPILKNCRSCRAAKPIENAQWACRKYNQIIPREFIPNGCAEHEGII